MFIATFLACILFPGFRDAKDDEAKIRELITRMRSDYLTERQEAWNALQKIGAPAEALLIEALVDSDFRVRRASLNLLIKIKSEKAIPRVSEISRGDREATVREAAFTYLCTMGKAAEEELIDALDSEESDHRMRALKALSAMKSRKCVAKVAKLYEREEVKAIRAVAFRCLTELGDVASPYLIDLLTSDDAKVRSGAIEGLSGVKTPEVLKAIGAAFVKEGDEGALSKCFSYLSVAGQDALPCFLAGLKSDHELGRKRSISGLARLKSEEAIGPVGELFRTDPSEGVIVASGQFLDARGEKAEEEFLRAIGDDKVLVRVTAIRALGKLKSDKAFERIALVFREEGDKEVHRAAFTYLLSREKRAEKELIGALDDADRKIRKQAIQALGRMKSGAAMDRLVGFLSELDATLRDEAIKALGAIGPKGLEAVEEAVKEGRLGRRTADLVLVQFYEEHVVRLFEKLITDQGGAGYYEGQFRELREMESQRVIPVLLKIARKENLPVMVDNRFGGAHEHLRQKVAIMALGDLGDASLVESLRKILSEAPGTPVSTRAEIVMAIHKLGDKKPLQAFLGEIRSEAEELLKGDLKTEGCRRLFSEALLLGRVGRHEEAEALYRRLLEEAKRPGVDAENAQVSSAHYNLACLSARQGRKQDALAQLRAAVQAGFRDREWILRDKDLDSLRDEEGYRKLIADDKVFEP